MRALLAALALSAAGPSLLAGQEMRDYSVARQHHGESRLDAHLEFAAGTIHVVAGPGDQLYRMQLSYDADRFTPMSRYDASDGSLSLGIESTGKAGLRVSARSQLTQVAAVALNPMALLSLDATVGASTATFELGGLRLVSFRLTSGATSATVSFATPNLVRCSSMTIESGAGGLMLAHLGNSRCEKVNVTGGMGQTTLDLTGNWGNGSAVTVQMTAGTLALRIPQSLGVRVHSERFLSSFPSDGWIRAGGALLSRGYASASQHLDLSLDTSLGTVKVEWVR